MFGRGNRISSDNNFFGVALKQIHSRILLFDRVTQSDDPSHPPLLVQYFLSLRHLLPSSLSWFIVVKAKRDHPPLHAYTTAVRGYAYTEQWADVLSPHSL